ncbi:hypothetical protein ACFQXA_19355 [Nocardiopsis composta]
MEKKKGGKATPLVLGLVGCGLVLILVIGAATAGVFLLSAKSGEPDDPTTADPTASASPSPRRPSRRPRWSPTTPTGTPSATPRGGPSTTTTWRPTAPGRCPSTTPPPSAV